MRIIYIIIALLVSACSGITDNSEHNYTINNQTNNSEDFSIFWRQYREKVLKHDIIWLKLNTVFPLTVKGRQDTDTIYKISNSDFENVFDLFLKTKTDMEYGTNLEYIKVTKESNAENHDGWPSNYRRMNEMIFYFTGNDWKLAEIYMDMKKHP